MDYYLTDETFTFVITPNDIAQPYNQYANDYFDLGQPFGINMGCYLDSSVSHYYCEVVQYSFQKHQFNRDNSVSSMMISDLPEDGVLPNLIPSTFKPFTNPSAMASWYGGNSRQTTANLQSVKQNNSFVCKNFNSTTKNFQVLQFHSTLNNNGSSTLPQDSYGDNDAARGFEDNLAAGQILSVFPIAMMYMTPIHKYKVPRLLKIDESITLTISSLERTFGESGLDCIIPIPVVSGTVGHYKAQYVSLSFKMDTYENTSQKSSYSINFGCNNWNVANYGYGGGKDRLSILTTVTPIIFNANQFTTAPPSGACLDIANRSQDIHFGFFGNQMNQLKPSILDGECEWILNMRLYPIG